MSRTIKYPKKKVSRPPSERRSQIEIIERGPRDPVDLKDFKTKPSAYWEWASKNARET